MEPRRSNRSERGSRWLRKGLWQWAERCRFEHRPPKKKLGLKEEVIDHFQEGRGRKVEWTLDREKMLDGQGPPAIGVPCAGWPT